MTSRPDPWRCQWRHQKKSHLLCCQKQQRNDDLYISVSRNLNVFEFKHVTGNAAIRPEEGCTLGVSLIIICRASSFQWACGIITSFVRFRKKCGDSDYTHIFAIFSSSLIYRIFFNIKNGNFRPDPSSASYSFWTAI